MKKAVFVLGVASLLSTVCFAAGGKPGDEYSGVKIDDVQIVVKEDVIPVSLKIGESREIRKYDRELFGMCFAWRELDYLPMAIKNPGSEYPEINSDYVRLMKGLRLPLNRNGAAESQDIIWKKSVGPLSERPVQRSMRRHLPDGALVTGPAEWIRAVKAVDPDSRFVWTFNMAKEGAKEAAEAAEFLTGGPDTRWGKVRINSGLREPVNVEIWELGNEMDWKPMSIEEYLKASREIIRAVRKVCPKARFAASTVTSPFSARSKGNWPGWHQKLIRELGSELSYIVIHLYYCGYTTAFIEKSMLDKLRDDIRKSPYPNLKVFISEHAKWPPDQHGRAFYTHALTGCLDTAEFLIVLLARPEIGAATYHVHNGLQWAVMGRDRKTGTLYTMGTYDLFRLFNMVPFGSSVVESGLTGRFTQKGDRRLTGAVMKGPDGKLYVLLNNRLERTAGLCSVTAEKKYALRKTVLLTAPGLLDYNTLANRPIQLHEKAFDGRAAVERLSVPAHSLMLAILEPLN